MASVTEKFGFGQFQAAAAHRSAWPFGYSHALIARCMGWTVSPRCELNGEGERQIIMFKLIFTDPVFEGQSFELPDGTTTVGRAPDNTLIIDDACVSAHHCQILRYGREVIVRDAGSSNGTWIDDRPLRGQAPVHNGQTIRFASVEARLEMPLPKMQNDHTEVTAIYLHARASMELSTPPKPPSPTIIKPRPEPTFPACPS